MAVRRRSLPLKADPFAQLSLLDLQGVDSALAQLSHRRAHLPEAAELERLAVRRRDVDGSRVEVETRVFDLTRDQRKADAEVEQVRARRVRDQQRMQSGQITSAKDLASMQHEVVALDRRITTLEDEELEVMEALEEAQSELESVLAEVAELDAAVVDATTARDAAVAAIDGEVERAAAERVGIAAKVPAELMALYDKVRAQQNGLGAAAFRQRRCEGCRLELNGADVRELSAQPVDDVLRCPECNRILIRTPESGL